MVKVKDGFFRQLASLIGSDSYLLKSGGGYIGLHAARNNEADKVVRTDSSGYIQAGWINTTSGAFTGTPDRIYASNDAYIRYMTPANFFPTLANSGNNISITVGGQNRTLQVGYATNADTVDGYHETDFFRRNRGAIPVDFIDITTYTANAAGYANYSPGTYSVSRSGYSEIFVNLALNSGSTSALQFYTNYSESSNLYFRKTIDSNRVSGPWTTIVTNLNIATYADGKYVKKTGDTMTGVLHMLANQYPDTAASGSLDMANSDIYNVNSIKFADLCDSAAEGLQWYRDATHIDTIWVKSGVMYFAPNRTWGSAGTSYVIPICNSSVQTGLNADMLDGYHSSSFLTSHQPLDYLNIKDIRDTNPLPNDVRNNSVTAWFNNSGTPSSAWWSGFTVKGWSGSYAAWQLCGIATTSTSNTNLYYRCGVGTTWNAWQAVVTDSTVESYILKTFGLSAKRAAANATWGNQVGGVMAYFDEANGGGLAFRYNNPSSGKMSGIIDGYWYQQEGTYRCLDTSDITNGTIGGAFTALSYSGTTLSITIGGATKTCTINAGSVSGNYLPITGGTLTGNLRIKDSSNYGMKLNFGDGEYVYFYEDTDDHLTMYADKGFDINTGSSNKIKINGYSLFQTLSYSGSTLTIQIGDVTKTCTISGGSTSGNYLPITGGTLTGNLRIKDSSNYGMKLNFGDGDYVYLYEDSDDHLVIKASSGIDLQGSSVTVNGQPIGSGGTSINPSSLFTALSYSGTTLSMTIGGVTKTCTISGGGSTTGNYLPITGGTLTGNLRIKGSSNYGMKLNLGDGEYVYFYEDTDDHLIIHADKGIDLQGTSITVNGQPIGSGGTSTGGASGTF